MRDAGVERRVSTTIVYDADEANALGVDTLRREPRSGASWTIIRARPTIGRLLELDGLRGLPKRGIRESCSRPRAIDPRERLGWRRLN